MALLTSFERALGAESLNPSIEGSADIFSPLLGSWRIRAVEYSEDGDIAKTYKGEWHFARVMQGLMVQDVLLVPGGQGGERESIPMKLGTSIRTHLGDGEWKVIWISPTAGAEDHLTAHRRGDQIVQIGEQGGGRKFRWSFTEIKEDSFVWNADTTEDGGSTWTLRGRFYASRISTDRSD